VPLKLVIVTNLRLINQNIMLTVIVDLIWLCYHVNIAVAIEKCPFSSDKRMAVPKYRFNRFRSVRLHVSCTPITSSI